MQVLFAQYFLSFYSEGSHSIMQVWNKSEKYGYSSYFQLHKQPSTVEKVTVYLMSEIISDYCPSTPKEGQNKVQENTRTLPFLFSLEVSLYVALFFINSELDIHELTQVPVIFPG